jgi:Beta-ketoacyl synthase, C-terminal domain
MQSKLIEKFYKTIDFDPNQINFVEAHATGTKLGDPEEAHAIDEVIFTYFFDSSYFKRFFLSLRYFVKGQTDNLS